MPPFGFKRNETNYCKFLTDEEFKAIERYITERLKNSPPTQMAIFILLYTGLRVGEVVKLKRENFNKDFSLLTFKPLKRKGQFIHTRAIPEILRSKLVIYNFRYKRRYRNNFMFFPYGNQVKNDHIQESTIQIWFSRMRKEIGLDDIYYIKKRNKIDKPVPLYRVSPHTLRHYVLFKLYDKSKDIKACQQIIGHKKLETTASYINVLKSKCSGYEQELINSAFE